jgi:hypothetical protein
MGTGQSIQQPAPVRFRHDTWVGDHDDAAIGTAANQSAKALFQPERRVWQHVLDEGIATMSDDRFAVRGGNRLGWHSEGKLGKHEGAKRVTRDVDALPKRRGAEEDRASRLTKARE